MENNISLHEAIINELHLTDKALKYKMDKSWDNYEKANKKANSGLDNLQDKYNKDLNKARKIGNTAKFKPVGNETDVDQEKRLYPKETSKISNDFTTANRELDRYHRAREKFNKKNPTAQVENKARDLNYGSTTDKERVANNYKYDSKSTLYKKNSNHWGLKPEPEITQKGKDQRAVDKSINRHYNKEMSHALKEELMELVLEYTKEDRLEAAKKSYPERVEKLERKVKEANEDPNNKEKFNDAMKALARANQAGDVINTKGEGSGGKKDPVFGLSMTAKKLIKEALILETATAKQRVKLANAVLPRRRQESAEAAIRYNENPTPENQKKMETATGRVSQAEDLINTQGQGSGPMKGDQIKLYANKLRGTELKESLISDVLTLLERNAENKAKKEEVEAKKAGVSMEDKKLMKLK